MATIKLKFRPSSAEGKAGTFFYQVIHQRSVKQVKTSYHVYPSEWDNRISSLNIATAEEARKPYLRLVADKTAWEQGRMLGIARQWERQGKEYTVDELVEEFVKQPTCQTVFTFMQTVIDRKQSMGQVCSARNFTTVLHRLQEFRMGEDFTFSSLDRDMMERFEAWLQQERGLRRNTTSSYFRILRTVYLAAVEQGLDSHRPLFSHVYMGIDATTKRALTKKQLQDIRQLDLTAQPHLALTRDLFLLSFYLRGMPFVDMAYLKKTDLHSGFVHYCRRKTHKHIEVRWEKQMQEILDRYRHLAAETSFLLPIILKEDGTERKQYESAMLRQNRNLKTIGRMIKLPMPLTQYAARHSWASLAYTSNVPLSVISRGMGHSNEQVTQTYIKTLDTSAVDRANQRIIRL